MRQLDLFSSLQPTAENLDTEFKSARGGLPGSFIALREALPSYHVDYRERLSSDAAVRWTWATSAACAR